MSKRGDQHAGGDRGDSASDDHRQVADARLGGRDAGHDLEVDGQVVEQQEEGAAEEKYVNHGGVDGALFQDTSDDHGTFAEEVFEDDEEHDDDPEGDEGADDRAGGPGFRYAAPLQRQEIADDACEHESVAERIHLKELLFQNSFLWHSRRRSLEEKEDNDSGDAADRKIDIEAPSPRDMVCEYTSKKGPDDTRYAVTSTQHASEGRCHLG